MAMLCVLIPLAVLSAPVMLAMLETVLYVKVNVIHWKLRDEGDLTCSDIDVNECQSGPCSVNAACENFEGGYVCACNAGYSGDGFVCAGAIQTHAA